MSLIPVSAFIRQIKEGKNVILSTNAKSIYDADAADHATGTAATDSIC